MKIKEPAYYNLPITDWPESDRPREKLIKSGPFKLTDSELLAIIIRTGTGKSSALDVARNTLGKAGGFEKLAEMTYSEIIKLNIPGIGTTKAVTIAAAIHLSRRIHSISATPTNRIIKSSGQVAEIYLPKLRDLKKEIFMAVFLATNNKIIGDTIISEGTINSSAITPREVFHEAILSLAASIILIHNHPSGNIIPSKEDIFLTNKMVKTGHAMEIPIIDHIIIGGDKYSSFLDTGLL